MNRRKQAEQVGAALPLSRLHPAVRRYLATQRGPARWCVAVSGGADSLALLYLVWAHFPAQRTKLVVLHFDHRLRGAASAADARFCQSVCRGLGVRCMVGRWQGTRRGTSEAAARLARHAFFAQAMAEVGSSVLWLAHQRDDVAETLLMRLARGSGTGGLAAPRPMQVIGRARTHLRPLLDFPRTELERVLRAAGAQWREDQSNQSLDHFRNRIRHAVLPAWTRSAGRDALAGAALSRELLEEDDDALEAWTDQAQALRRGVLDTGRTGALPRAVQRRLLHRWLLAVGPATDLSRQGFSLLLEAVRVGKDTRFSLGAGFAVIRGGSLKFERGRKSGISR